MTTTTATLKTTLDRKIYWGIAFLFPAFMFVGFAKSYYLKAFFDSTPFANLNVHLHGLVMSLWIVLFTVQIALVRTRNIRLHIKLGMFGVVLAIAVVISGFVTMYDSFIVRSSKINGMDSSAFIIIPLTSIVVFAILFTAAIWYRRKAIEHKSLMFLTAINFLPFAFSRMPFIPEQFMIPWAFGAPDLLAVGVLVWHSFRHRKINKVFAIGLLLVIVSFPFRLIMMQSDLWLGFIGALIR